MFTLIVGESADELWHNCAKLFRSELASIQGGRGGQTNEIPHAVLCLKNPRERWVMSRQPALNPAFALAEVVWMLSGRNDSRFLTYFNSTLPKYAGDGPTFHGAYGYRLRKVFGLDQVNRAFRTLESNPTSRQVVLQIWDAKSDLPLTDGIPVAADVPCNLCSMLKVRNGKLDWSQIMRSNDLFRGLPYNIVQFTFLQELMASWLKLEIGEYHHFSDSLHVYEDCAQIISDNNSIVTFQDNPDSFAESYEESYTAIHGIESFVEMIINPNVCSDEVLDRLQNLNLVKAWRNIAVIIGLEGLRRRRYSKLDDILTECSNPQYHALYTNWLQRLNR